MMSVRPQNGHVPPQSQAQSTMTSFQKMLELEKKYKLARLQKSSSPSLSQRQLPSGPPLLPHHQRPSSSYVSPAQDQYRIDPRPSFLSHHQRPASSVSQSPHEPLSSHPVQSRRQKLLPPPPPSSSSSSQVYPEPPGSHGDINGHYPSDLSPPNDSMLMMKKAARSSITLASLSIGTPSSESSRTEDPKGKRQQQASSSDRRKRLTLDLTDTKIRAEPASGDEESICQSPTWSGFRESEKKKKVDKKQKKKEKEQAAKDAKIAKKRLLTKAPPSAHSRSASVEPSPSPASSRRQTGPLGIQYEPETPTEPQDGTAQQQQQQHYVPSGKRPPVKATNSFVGGVKLASERGESATMVVETRQKAIDRDNLAAINPSAVVPTSFAITSGSLPRLGRKTPTTPAIVAAVVEKGRAKERERGREREERGRPPVASRGKISFHHPRRNSMTDSSNNAVEDYSLPAPNVNSLIPNNSSAPNLHHDSLMSLRQDTYPRPGSSSGRLTLANRSQTAPVAVSVPGPDGNTGGFASEFEGTGFLQNDVKPAERWSRTASSAVKSFQSPTFSEGGSSQSPHALLSPSDMLSPGKAPSSPAFSFMSNSTSHFEYRPVAAVVTSPTLGSMPEASEPTTTTAASSSSSTTATTALTPAAPLPLDNSLSSSIHGSHDNSRISERSSPSSCSEPTHVSPVTTPASSRPQSQKGGGGGSASTSRAVGAGGNSSKDQDVDLWSRSSGPFDVDQHSMSHLDLNDTRSSSSPHRPAPVVAAAAHSSSSQPDEGQDAATAAHSFLPPLRHQSLAPPAPKGNPEPRSSPHALAADDDARSRSMSPAASSVESRTETMPSSEEGGSGGGMDTPTSSSGPASYLQEARKSTLAPPPATTAALRSPHHPHQPNQRRISHNLAAAAGLPLDKPISKMFVECCNCRFLHDMPSRVYECMVKPDSLVEDRRLGVSGAITTMVKCPWCAHNMSTDCCAGYMALVVMQKRMH